MMVIHECSECGGRLSHITLACMPPIERYTCQKCGRVKDVRHGESVVTVDMSGRAMHQVYTSGGTGK